MYAFVSVSQTVAGKILQHTRRVESNDFKSSIDQSQNRIIGGRQVEQGGQGEGARESRGWERDLSERESGNKNEKKNILVFCLYLFIIQY